tara:strand:- start:43 stop:525 length:483 start_codon:yes stop_codon:yes gene_type:complete
MKSLAFLIILIVFVILIHKKIIPIELFVVNCMLYYKVLIGVFLVLLLLINPEMLKKVFTGKPKNIKSEDLISEFNFVNHVRNLTSNVEMKNQRLQNEKIKFFLSEQKGLCNNCRVSMSPYQCNLDLKKPISLGGNTDNSNLQVLCTNCYNEKQSINTFLK